MAKLSKKRDQERHTEAFRKLEIVMNRLDDPKSKQIVYDSETSGLDWRHNHVVGHVLTFGPRPTDSYYLPFRHLGGGNILPDVPQEATGWDGVGDGIETQLLGKLDRPGRTVVGHNLAFDLKFLWRLKGTPGFKARFEDTQINAPLINEWQPKFSLEYCTIAADVQVKLAQPMYDHIAAQFPEAKGKGAMGHYWRLAGDDKMAVEYAEGDGTSTWQLRDWQMERIRAEELDLVWDVESRLIPVLARMSCRGVRVDEDKLHELREQNDDTIARLKEEIGNPDFNTLQHEHIIKFLTDRGQTDWPFTKHRNPRPSFTEDWLQTHEPGRQIIAIRKLENLNNSFVVPLIERHLWNGRVHTDFNQLRGDEYGTVTGRLSSSGPNMQQVHKRNVELGRLFRQVFIPDEGMIWGSNDYKQCEPVLLAFYSRAKVLVNGFLANPPVDPHSAVTKATNPDWESLTDKEFKDRREIGKRVSQTLITGGGVNVLEQKYKVQNARQVLTDYFRAMPEVKNLQNHATKTMSERGYIVSLLGRRARLNDPDKAFHGMNRILQCGNADIIKLKMVEIDEYLESVGRPPVDILLNVHDALEDQFAEEAREYHEECLRIMQDFGPGQVIELDIPLKVDSGEGPNWAIATYGEE